MNTFGIILIGIQLILIIYLLGKGEKAKWIGIVMNTFMLFFWIIIWPALNLIGH